MTIVIAEREAGSSADPEQSRMKSDQPPACTRPAGRHRRGGRHPRRPAGSVTASPEGARAPRHLPGLKLRSRAGGGGWWDARDRGKAGELARPVTHRTPPRAAAGERDSVPGGGRALEAAPVPVINNPAPGRQKPEAGALSGATPAGSAAHPARGINNNVIKSPPGRRSGWRAGAAGSRLCLEPASRASPQRPSRP